MGCKSGLIEQTFVLNKNNSVSLFSSKTGCILGVGHVKIWKLANNQVVFVLLQPQFFVFFLLKNKLLLHQHKQTSKVAKARKKHMHREKK